MAALRGKLNGTLEAVVLDLRGNSGGLLGAGVNLANALLAGGPVVRVDGRSSESRLRFSADERDILDGAPLLVLIDDILDISKIESGKLAIQRSNFDLHALLNSTATMLSPQASDKGLRLQLHIAPHTPYLLYGDDMHLRQVLINLLGNAVKFTSEGCVALRVSVENDGRRTMDDGR